MLEKGEKKAVLTDSDWAEEAGKVRYTVTSNDGFGYPGVPRGPVVVKDNCQVYETWEIEIWSTLSFTITAGWSIWS